MEVAVGVSGGELVSINHDSWLNMCMLAPESIITHRGVVVELEGITEMVFMEMPSSEARMAGTGAGATGAVTGGLRETEGS